MKISLKKVNLFLIQRLKSFMDHVDVIKDQNVRDHMIACDAPAFFNSPVFGITLLLSKGIQHLTLLPVKQVVFIRRYEGRGQTQRAKGTGPQWLQVEAHLLLDTNVPTS